MGYSDRSGDVRADFFTYDARLKWKYTDVLDMEGVYKARPTVHTAVAIAWTVLERYSDLIIVVLEPYHDQGYPVMMSPKQRIELFDEWKKTQR